MQLDNPGYSAFLGEYTRERSDGLSREQAFEQMLATDSRALRGSSAHTGPTRSACTSAAATSRACGSARATTSRSPSACSASCRSTASCSSTTTSAPVASSRCGSCRRARWPCSAWSAASRPELETIDELQARIDEATEYVDWDFLALSPQCGFASVAEGGNEMTAGSAVREAAAGLRRGARDLGHRALSYVIAAT